MKISIQTQPMVDYFGIRDAYRMIREAGFEAVDWGLDRAWRTSAVIAAKEFRDLCIFEKDLDTCLAHYAEELDAMRENGLVITQVHAPCPAYHVDAQPGMTDYAIGILSNVIRFCQAVGCPRVVIHAVSSTARDYITREEVDRLNHYLFESLIPALQETDVVVCIENLPIFATNLNNKDSYPGSFCKPQGIVEFIDALNEKAGKECFGICLDSGHLHLTAIRPYKFIEGIGKRLRAFHLHDNMKKFDAHLMPYMGSVRWAEFLTSLRKIGYDGDINFETCGQIGAHFLPKELIPVFLETTADIGRYFRSQIQAKD